MKTVLIVGTSFSSLRKYLTDHGYDYVVLKDATKTKHPSKNLKRRIVCDFSSDATMLAAVDKALRKYDIQAVLTTYENYVLPAAKIAQYLGLPGMPPDAAIACTDKYIMRQLFAKSPKKISPDFAEVTSLNDVLTFARQHPYPLILKPANLAKSLLVTKNMNEQELIDNYQKMSEGIEAIYKKYAPQRHPKILIEEFMAGPVHSVDAFVDSNGVPHVLEQVVDYQTGYEIGYDDNFHYSRILPSALTNDQIEDIRETAAIGCRALGMKSSPAHIEIIRTSSGPRIVEIGARNGGYRERMHALANGIDITGNAVLMAIDGKPDIQATRNDPCAVLELFPKNAGIFEGIQNEKSLQQLPSTVYYAVKQEIGKFVGSSSDGYKMCAIIVLHNSDKEQFNADLEYINLHVRALTDND